MRVLVICGDHYHPGAVLQEGLAEFGQGEFALDWLLEASAWDAARLAAYPVVLLARSSGAPPAGGEPWASDAVQAALRNYVRGGGGLLCVHAGTAGYLDLPVMRGLVGGGFVQHPPQCPVTVIPVAEHPLTAGCAPFTLTDEHYHMALDDAQADVFLATRSEHGEQPGGWTRREGAGRVAVLTPGHVVEVWRHPSFQALLRNALRWCAGAS